MGKTDIHLHLGPKTVEFRIPGKSFKEGDKPHDAVFKSSGSLDMLPHLAELGITKGVILSGGETGHNTNDNTRLAASLAPDTYGWMCNLDYKEPETVKQRLQKCKELGAVGIGEFAVNRWIDDPFIEAVFAAAEELELPVLFHMSPEQGFNYGIADRAGLPLLEQALQRHPKLILIGHSQPFWHEMSGDAAADKVSRNEWGSGPVAPGGRLWELFAAYPNLYGDLSANSGGNALMRDEENGLRFLAAFQDRLMFGTDMCNTDMEFPLGKWLDRMLHEGKLSQAIYDKVCFANAKALLGI
jgi:hypothetical protein